VANQNPLPSPVITDKLDRLLQGYNQVKRSFLLNGFTSGFKLGYVGLRHFRRASNKRSALENKEMVVKKLSREISLGRVQGPFQDPPFPHLQVSPIGLVPKNNPGEFRLIHDLSFPWNDSINSAIPPEFSSVQYASIDDAINHIRSLGPHCLMAKTDIDSAFRLIPIHPSDYELLGFMWDDNFFFDRCLPMGASSSCAIFESFSSALEWIAESKLKIQNIVHMLDDFLFLGPPHASICQRSLDLFVDTCALIGVPIKQEKTVNATTCIQFLGIILDSHKMEARLPEDKVLKLRTALASCYKKRTLMLRDLQSLLGLLNFACKVIIPGRAFMQRLYRLSSGVSHPRHHVTLNQEARRDLAAWKMFIDHFNGKSFFLADRWVLASHLNLFTDSSGSLGFAAIFGTHFCYGRWPHQWSEINITDKELFPIVLAVEIWGHMMANRCIIFHCDNSAVVHIINKQSAKSQFTMVLVRRLVISCMTHNILCHAEHVPGVNNTLADALSRLQMDRFYKLAPAGMDSSPTPIPRESLHI